MSKARLPRLLVIGGSDSSGGAGIQADIKTATSFGVYAMTAVTAVTAQDTKGIKALKLMPPELVAAQMRACLKDIGADAVKIGMLGSAEIALAVIEVLRDCALDIPNVLDPVMASTSGTPLLDEEGVRVLREEFLPFSTLVTPNLREAEVLTGVMCDGSEDIERAALALTRTGAKTALLKGGHGSDTNLTDIFVQHHRIEMRLSHQRQDTAHTHGTGCTYATAIASGMARFLPMEDAVRQAHRYIQAAIATAPGFGRGHGPLNHMHGSGDKIV